jgi:hypothetical protein
MKAEAAGKSGAVFARTGSGAQMQIVRLKANRARRMMARDLQKMEAADLACDSRWDAPFSNDAGRSMDGRDARRREMLEDA